MFELEDVFLLGVVLLPACRFLVEEFAFFFSAALFVFVDLNKLNPNIVF